MEPRAPTYLSFMLRLYRVDDEKESAWRMSLESPLTRERMGFASLEDLFAFLQQQMGMVSSVNQDSCATRTENETQR
jgi:hypothetical protein